MELKYDLTTSAFESKDTFLNDFHPRPNFSRDDYLLLDGPWNYIINNDGNISGSYLQEIIVPFPIESYLSHVQRRLNENEHFIYKKVFDYKIKNERIILHFDAIDQIAVIYLNGNKIGSHSGGYLPFSIDVTNFIKEKDNELYVDVIDDNSYDYPTGKQRKKRGGIFYTPTSGIWQSVWLEGVPRKSISDFKINTDIDNKLLILDISSEEFPINIQISYLNKIIKVVKADFPHVEISFEEIALWSPEEPNLYDLKFETSQDTVYSYFGFRKISIKDDKILLNNKPYFINGVLDQGYYSDGIYTPFSYASYKEDILNMKALGFNTLRKHIKIEPMRFYYLCDKLGILVLQDMVNMGKVNTFKHGVLPTLGLKRLKFTDLNEEQQQVFYIHTRKTIEYLYNVTSIVYWTIFNEGWGEFHPDKVYKFVKELDQTRIVDATSGWFFGHLSDVNSYHIYFKKIRVHKSKRPNIISECGGYCFKLKDHSFLLGEKNNTFYHMFKDLNDFEKAFINLYKKQILKAKKKSLAGVIYTQLSDVEDETNGIYTYDRKVCKLNKNVIYPLMENINKEG